jgi:ATP-dependent Clp protease ATP-binding subunit ClpA
LQVMDHGKLTDHNGKQVDFRNVILIMTTNAGASDLAKSAFGFTRSKREGDDLEAVNRLFTPEFRNRLDSIIAFGHLPKEVVAQVVDKFVMQLDAQLSDRNISIELSSEARDWLVEHGYDEAMGARPMARLIQTSIKQQLADEILFGRLKNGGTVRVIVVPGEDGAKRSLGFVYPEGPLLPRQETLLLASTSTPKKAGKSTARQAARKGDKGSDGLPSVPPSGKGRGTGSGTGRSRRKAPVA